MSSKCTAEAVISSLPLAFDRAVESKDVLFYPSTINTYPESGVEFEIRLCPALQHKPAQPVSHSDEVSEKHDPFCGPFGENLVGEIVDEEEGERYVVLLNRFCVVPHHFLLVTKDFKSQTAPLFPSDLVQVYLFLQAAQKRGRIFFAFYNCGDLSGASQPHKHVQLFPLDESASAPPMDLLMHICSLGTKDEVFSLDMPYANHVFRFPRSLASASRESLEDTLVHAYHTLYDLGVSTARRVPEFPAKNLSYNVIITLEHMHFIPRSQESHRLQTGELLSVNALGYAGMLLVKSDAQLEQVKSEGIANILRAVGLENIPPEEPAQDS
ncbi:HIT-like protein [Fistulina hepatica ATCC 64428]|uniref:HIT-like protein n=1 Tax=Fistulina hepatica ATCC 64428 TaxID=1128425 RepID=A0A0D7A3E0_9AGAR|nr:HIT-like protein [Fistulina hepatica ATCC 64428]